MKKFLIAFLLVALVGGVFAQELKISGYLNSGLDYWGGKGARNSEDEFRQPVDREGLHAIAHAHNYDADFYRAELDFVFTVGNIGSSIRFRSMGGDTAFMGHAFVWADLFNKYVRLEGGFIDSSPWNTYGDINDDVGEGLGLQVQVMPIEGLNVGFGAYYGGTVFDNYFGVSIFDYTDQDRVSISMDRIKYTLGFNYLMEDVFGVQGSLAFLDKEVAGALFGISVHAVPNLTAEFEFWLQNLMGDFADFTMFAQTIGYDFNDSVSAGIVVYEYILKHMDDFPFEAWPWVSYAFNDSIVATMCLGYGFNMRVDPLSRMQYFDPLFSNGLKQSVFAINPSVNFQVGPNAFIDLGFQYNIQIEDRKFDNDIFKVYLDFLWTF